MAVRKTKKKVRHSKGGSKKNGRMYARGSRVGVARVKNGVLHIVAPPNVSVLKPPKTSKRRNDRSRQKDVVEYPRRSVLVSQQASHVVLNH